MDKWLISMYIRKNSKNSRKIEEYAFKKLNQLLKKNFFSSKFLIKGGKIELHLDGIASPGSNC